MADNYDIDQDSLSSAVTFLEQFLVSKLPSYDFSPGTANRDIAINSIALVFAVLRQDISLVKSGLTLNDLKDKTDDTSNQMVDAILSDFFVTRHTGDYATGNVTLYFSSNSAVNVVITNSNIFVKDGVSYTLNAASKGISADELVQNTDNYGKTYYTTTANLIAKVKGPTGKASTGIFESWDVNSPYLYKVEVLEEFSGGEGSETSSDLINRGDKALTVKNLVTQNAIYTVLMAKFQFLKNAVAIGMNDKEMTRDLLAVTVGNTVMNVHRGSMIDIYCKLPIVFKATVTSTVALHVVSGSNYYAIKLPSIPIYKIHSVVDVANNNASLAFNLVVSNKDLFLSGQQEVYVDVGNDHSNKSIKVTYDYAGNSDEVQAFVDSSTERTVVANSLVKAQFAMYLSFDIAVYANSDIDSDTILTALQTYIHSSEVTTSNLYISNIIKKVATDYSVIVQTPLTIKGSLLLSNGSTMEITFKDRVFVPPKYLKTNETVARYLPFFDGDENTNNYEVGLMSDLQISDSTTRLVMDTSESTIKRI